MSKTISPDFIELYRRPVNGPASFTSDAVTALNDWWLGFHPLMPSMNEFDIVDHANLAPNLFLYKILEPGVYQYRLNGEEVVQLTGATQAGVTFSDKDQDQESVTLANYLNQVVESRIPWTCGGSMAHVGRDHLRFESIDCPLAGKDGRVTHILGVMVKIG